MDSSIFDSFEEHISFTYPSYLKKLGLDVIAIKAEGAVITDSRGNSYIDCIGGYGLSNLGHNHPIVIKALVEQLQKKEQFNKPFIIEPQVKLAKLLANIAPGDLSCSFICNSGSEAIDSALKLARLCQRKSQIITAIGSFHGFTFGALSATGIQSFKRSFGPLVPDFVHVPFGDSRAISEHVTPNTAAVLLEPVQHEAGVATASKSYFQEVRQICTDRNILLIIDEIKTGFGKIGHMFACDYYGIVPDILVVGKSIGGGLVPIGAMIGQKKLWRKFSLSFPMSASSYAGNVLACKAAISTIKVLQSENLLEHCIKKGETLMKSLNQIQIEFPDILTKVTGLGLLIGVQTSSPRIAMELSKKMISQGVLVVQTFGNSAVLMIEPPLVISNNQISQVLKAFKNACSQLSNNLKGT